MKLHEDIKFLNEEIKRKEKEKEIHNKNKQNNSKKFASQNLSHLKEKIDPNAKEMRVINRLKNMKELRDILSKENIRLLNEKSNYEKNSAYKKYFDLKEEQVKANDKLREEISLLEEEISEKKEIIDDLKNKYSVLDEEIRWLYNQMPFLESNGLKESKYLIKHFSKRLVRFIFY